MKDIFINIDSNIKIFVVWFLQTFDIDLHVGDYFVQVIIVECFLIGLAVVFLIFTVRILNQLIISYKKREYIAINKKFEEKLGILSKQRENLLKKKLLDSIKKFGILLIFCLVFYLISRYLFFYSFHTNIGVSWTNEYMRENIRGEAYKAAVLIVVETILYMGMYKKEKNNGAAMRSFRLWMGTIIIVIVIVLGIFFLKRKLNLFAYGYVVLAALIGLGFIIDIGFCSLLYYHVFFVIRSYFIRNNKRISVKRKKVE